jgi:hypothetical protein
MCLRIPVLALSTCLLAACGAPDGAGTIADNPAVRATSLGENLNLTPTAWWWYYGQTPAAVASLLSSNNGRLVSLQVESTSPLLFTVAMVQNSGSYAKQWWWYYGKTGSELAALTQSLNARIVALDPYIVNGTTYFAAILISNSGADAKSWWWYYGVSPAQITTLLSQHNARLVDLRQYDGQYAVVMIENTGADQTGWWWYYNISGAQVASFLQQNNAFLISIEPANPSGSTFNVIMNQVPGGLYWWWYYGASAASVASAASQDGARILDIKSYFGNGTRQFAVILVNNSNAETTRVGQLLRNGTDGQSGFYVKEVNGPVLGALQERVTYDPASSIKIVVATALLKRVAAANLTTTTTNYYPITSGSCPQDTGTPQSQPLGTLLRLMLVNSDNAATRALIDYVGGMSVINQTAQSLGMKSTNMNVYPGCNITNTMTQADVALLYEALANGSLLAADAKSALYAAMPADAGDATGTLGAARNIITSLAPGYGLTQAQISAFTRQFDLHYKAGGDTWCSGSSCSYFSAISGIAVVPVCNGRTPSSKQYVWGIFINGGSDQNRTSNTFFSTDAEPLREPIAAALAGWASCS